MKVPDDTEVKIYWYTREEGSHPYIGREYINLHWLGHTKQLKRSSPNYCRLSKILPVLEPKRDTVSFGERLRCYALTWAEYRAIVD